MEQSENTTSDKPQVGAWASAKGYPQKIKFEIDKPVSVTFSPEFVEPKEMPNTDGMGVFYIFECKDGNGDNASFPTSAWTLINSLKSHEPLAGKNLIITKKNVKGKNFFYVQKPDTYNAPEVEAPEADTDDAGLDEDGLM